MPTRRLFVGLAQYAAVSAGQAIIAVAIQQGVSRATYELERRKRARRQIGFR